MGYGPVVYSDCSLLHGGENVGAKAQFVPWNPNGAIASSRPASAAGLEGGGKNGIKKNDFKSLHEFLVALLAVPKAEPQVDELCQPLLVRMAQNEWVKRASKKISKVPLTVFY